MANSEFLEKANRLIETQKYFMRLLYQLVFILTSDSPASKEAKELIEKMKEMGLVTDIQIGKAIEDVKRFRERVLDRVFNP
ncbi:MAG: hypothetical protein QXT14_08920 [Candidatus Bathyarchaeia archaeon]